jgi:hypothetical protein
MRATRIPRGNPGESAVMGAGRRPAGNANPPHFERLEIAEEEMRRLSGAALIDRLVSSGISRLSAERMVAIERGIAEPGRARAHMQARR